LEEYQYKNELKNNNREQANKIKKLEESVNSDEENKKLKQNNLKLKKKISDLEKELKEKYEINAELINRKDEIARLEKELQNVKNENEKYKLNEIKLKKYINNYEQIKNKLREKENIINEYKNECLNIQKIKENEIININNKLEERQNYINKLENINREKENELKKLKKLQEEYQNLEGLLNKSNEENKKIKKINLKNKKKLEEQYKINEKLNSIINELENGKNENKDIINEIKKNSENEASQMKKEYDSKIQKYKNEINKLKKKIIEKEKENNNNEQIYDKKRKELDEKEKIIKQKENEINKKISFLEDKENLIEKEKKEIDIKKRELEKLKKEIEENKSINKKKIFERNPLEKYKVPPLVGLTNIGATCFMNSTLQCLSQTKELAKYFLNIKNENRIINNNIAIVNKNDLQLSPIFLELIKKLWDPKGKIFPPHNFMNVVEKMNPLFKKGQAGDSKDFIIFILEQLHKELKKPVNNYSENKLILNQYDKDNAFTYFFNDFRKDCSIISDIFFGFTETTNECLYCKNNYNSKGYNNPICYNYGLFNCLIFPLEEVKNMKNNQIQNNNIQINNNIVSIYDCFFYNQKSEVFSGDNRNYCNICKQLWDSIYTSKIFSSPINLILILNRGKGNVFDVKLDFYETIDITQFVLQKDKPQIMYNLYGVITHIGESGPNAHFVASCKSPIDNKWYRFNDAMINPITNFQKEVIKFGTPYILFYNKI